MPQFLEQQAHRGLKILLGWELSFDKRPIHHYLQTTQFQDHIL